MKEKSIILSLIFSFLVLSITGCNNDVFIKELKVSPLEGILGPDNRTMHISVSGGSWSVPSVSFYSREGSSRPVPDGSTWHVHTPYTDIYVQKAGDGLYITLERFISDEPAELIINMDDGYDAKTVNITVAPTEPFNIRIESIDYRLDAWGGYPDEDFIYTDALVSYPDGLYEPTTYTFPDLKVLPVLYLFRTWGEPDIFKSQVLSSHIVVPVPTYFDSANTPDFGWEMRGEKARLTTVRSYYETSFIPPLPEPVLLPAGKPLTVGVCEHYKCLAVDFTIRAVNPATEKTETITGQFVVWTPVKLTSQVLIK